MSNDSDDIFCNHSIKNDFLPILITYSSTRVVSALMCIPGIVLIVLFHMYKLLTNRIILYLLMASLFFCLANIFQISELWMNFWKREHYNWCITEGFIVQYSQWVMFLSTLMVTVHLTIMVLFDRCYQNITKLEPFYLLFPWIFPLITTAWIPFVHNNYGISGPWCWIRLYNDDCSWNKEGMIEVYGLWYGELCLGQILNNIALAVVLVILCKRSCHNTISLDYRKALKQTLPLVGFPFIFQVLSWISLGIRIHQSLLNGNYIGWLFHVHAFASSSCGFFAGLFTVFYLVTLSEFRNSARQIFCCKCFCKKIRKRSNSDGGEYKILIDVDDHVTQYGITVTNPTGYSYTSESDVEREYDQA